MAVCHGMKPNETYVVRCLESGGKTTTTTGASSA